MPGRADRVGASAAAQWPSERQRAAPRPCAPRRSRCSRAVMPRSGRRCRQRPTRAVRARGRKWSSRHPGAGRVVLRRAGRRQRPAALPGRGGARRAGRARSRDLGQLRRAARAAGALDRRRAGRGAAVAPCSAWRTRAAGRWRIVSGRRRPSRRTDPRRWSTSRADCCCVTAWCSGACSSARPTGCRRGATCCASTAARGARRDPRRPFRRRLLGEQFALPDAVGALREVRRKPAAEAWSRCPAPTRSTSSAS